MFELLLRHLHLSEAFYILVELWVDDVNVVAGEKVGRVQEGVSPIADFVLGKVPRLDHPPGNYALLAGVALGAKVPSSRLAKPDRPHRPRGWKGVAAVSAIGIHLGWTRKGLEVELVELCWKPFGGFTPKALQGKEVLDGGEFAISFVCLFFCTFRGEN